jgi:hypothetical protein
MTMYYSNHPSLIVELNLLYMTNEYEKGLYVYWDRPIDLSHPSLTCGLWRTP